jgi:hypothetical protein
MDVTTSSRWTYTLDLENATLRSSDSHEALRWAGEAEAGTLVATGERGDCVDMQFDAAHALPLYMAASGLILRPHFSKPEQVRGGR